MIVLDVLASFFAAVLAALGVGGGGLLVIYLVLVLNMGQHAAQGVNLIFFIVASLAALPFYIKKKRVRSYVALVFSSVGILGACLGCFLSARTSPERVRFYFGLMLVGAGGIALFKSLKFYFERWRRGGFSALREKGKDKNGEDV